MKKNGDQGKKLKETRPLVISRSTNPAPENMASTLLSSREQPGVVCETHREESEPQQDLQRFIQLMDGFKASKVIPTHSGRVLMKPFICFH